MANPFGSGSHALQDYQMQLMVLEQQNKKRLMARHGQDNTMQPTDDKVLLEPRIIPPRSEVPLPQRRSHLHLGLLTPQASPQQCLPPPQYQASMSNAPRLDQQVSEQIYNASCAPSAELGDLPPPLPLFNTTPLPTDLSALNLEWPQAPRRARRATGPGSNLAPQRFPSVDQMVFSLSSKSVASSAMVVQDPELKRPSTPQKFSSERSWQTNDSGFCDAPTPKSQLGEWNDYDVNNYSGYSSSIDDFLSTSTAVGFLNFWGFPQTELAQPPVQKVSSSSGLSKTPQEHDQDGDQSKSMKKEDGTGYRENRDHHALLPHSSGITSKHHFNEDLLISIEESPLPHPTKTPIKTEAEQNLACDRSQPFSAFSSFSRSASEACSWISSNETDWGDDESDEHLNSRTLTAKESSISSEQGLLSLTARPVLSKIKKDLVDRLMMEFWQIFNQENEFNVHEDSTSVRLVSRQCQEQDTNYGEQRNTIQASNSSAGLNLQANGARPTGGQNGKRERQDDDENDETERRNPKRPKSLLTPPRNQDDVLKFACPYRKHDVKKYCVRHWRTCALTPLETVARVKGHLYRHHRIFPCQRCKKLFSDQQGVTDHLKEIEGCMLIDDVQQDGITNEMVEKLRSKKKAHREQTEEDRWKEIYQILFPGEIVPSPFFEEIQEDVMHSPDSQELADYEEYCRRELPRVFRASLEEVVNNSTQPLEEQLRTQLMDLIRDAQDRVFTSYRASSVTTGTPTRGAPSSSPDTMRSSLSSLGFSSSPIRSRPPATPSSRDQSQPQLPPFFQPPSPRNHLESGLDISDPSITPSKPDRNDSSDSGYDSSSFMMPSIPLTHGESGVDTSALSSQALPLSDASQETISHTVSQSTQMQGGLYSNVEGTSGAENDHLDIEAHYPQNPFDFELDYTNLPNFDSTEEFWKW